MYIYMHTCMLKSCYLNEFVYKENVFVTTIKFPSEPGPSVALAGGASSLGIPAPPRGMELGYREQPEPSAFLTCLCDPPAEAHQASRSTPAAAVFRLRLGRGARLSDPGLATSRRQLR